MEGGSHAGSEAQKWYHYPLNVVMSMHVIDCAGDRLNKMIRSAEKAKTPIMCVVGDKERDAGRLRLSFAV